MTCKISLEFIEDPSLKENDGLLLKSSKNQVSKIKEKTIKMKEFTVIAFHILASNMEEYHKKTIIDIMEWKPELHKFWKSARLPKKISEFFGGFFERDIIILFSINNFFHKNFSLKIPKFVLFKIIKYLANGYATATLRISYGS